MTTLFFYVAMCTMVDNVEQCTDYEPVSWTYSVDNIVEADKAYEQCSLLANTFAVMEGYSDSDCYTR